MNYIVQANNTRAKFSFLSGSFLKVFAIVVMFIDHFAAGFILPSIITGDMYKFLSFWGIDVTLSLEILIYTILRGIGRMAFPIFCYLLVEGFYHTRNKLRYTLTLSLFAFISEIPFDITLIAYKAYDTLNLKEIYTTYSANIWGSQNVYFTLFLGVIAIWLSDTIIKKLSLVNTLIAYVVSVIPVAISAYIAYLLKTDYAAYGIIVIAIFYYFHNKRIPATILVYFFLLLTLSTRANGGMEEWSFPAFIIINFYNGQRGFIKKNFKYFFYIFYPAHLLVIFFIRYFCI